MPRYMTVQMTRDHSYRDRELRAGETVELPRRDAALLVAGRKARKVREVAVAPPPPAASSPPIDERIALRAEYEQVLGKAPFMGWSADLLREKIAAAKAESES